MHPKRAAPQAPQWPSYTGQSQFVGVSRSGVSIWVDPSLGAPGLQNAKDLLADADRVVAANNAIFGTLTKAVNVIVFALGGATDGTGGADHMACDYKTGQDIEVCASFGNSMRVSALFEAELSECSMSNNLCGLSTGEALSRWCAMDVSGNALSDFASAPTWQMDVLPDGSLQNFVDVTDQTDQNYDSIGCGMAFLSWMIGGLGISLTKIAPIMVVLGNNGTLAQLYQNVTGDSHVNAWSKFIAALSSKGTLTSDDPFGGMAPVPVPVPPPPPPPPPPPTPTPQTGFFHVAGILHGTIVSK